MEGDPLDDGALGETAAFAVHLAERFGGLVVVEPPRGPASPSRIFRSSAAPVRGPHAPAAPPPPPPRAAPRG